MVYRYIVSPSPGTQGGCYPASSWTVTLLLYLMTTSCNQGEETVVMRGLLW